MVPVEDFLEQFPEHVDDDESALMVARINHEHAERLKLEEQRQGLLKKKQALIAENNRRKVDLANLDQDLEKFIDVSAYRDMDGEILVNELSGCTTNSKDLGKGVLISISAASFVLHSAAYCIYTYNLISEKINYTKLFVLEDAESPAMKDIFETTRFLAAQPRPWPSSPSLPRNHLSTKIHELDLHTA